MPMFQSNKSFYDSLLKQQAAQGPNMNDSLSMLVKMAADSKTEKEAKKHDKKTKEFDSSQFDKFVHNESADSTFKYGSLKGYAASSFKALNEANGGKGVTMEAALASVDAKELSDKAKEKLCKGLGLDEAVAKDPERFKNVTIADSETFETILKSAGFKSGKTSITRQELETGLASLQEGKIKDSDDDSESGSTSSSKDAKSKIRDLKELLGKGDYDEGDESKIKSSVKDMMKDKTTFKAFLDSVKNDSIKNGAKGAKNPLTAIFSALNESNSGHSTVAFDALVDEMKDYAKENGLSKEWNEAIDSSKGAVTSADASSGSGWTTGILSTISQVFGAGYAIRNMTLSSAKKKDLEDIMSKAKI